jgi:hypothetical protein
MTWLFSETLPDLRWCGWCHGGLPATLEHFAPHRLGRYGLQSICRECQRQDGAVRRRLKREHPKVDTCACGAPATDLDHDHTLGCFRDWTCRPCNLRRRRPYVYGKIR